MDSMSNSRAVDRGTAYLLPPSVAEWLLADHLARFVVEIVEQLDFSDLTLRYRGSGSEAYHSQILAAVLLYDYATGTHSSRKLEQACYDSVAYRFTVEPSVAALLPVRQFPSAHHRRDANGLGTVLCTLR
jgi:transposase